MASIIYKSGYDHVLAADYHHQKTGIYPGRDIRTDFILLSVDGALIIKKYYAWDGPSGPSIETKNFMRGSLVHDALYQLIRERHLDYVWRVTADQLLRDICVQDGMTRARAWWVYQGVRFGGAGAAKVMRPVYTAP